MKSRAWVGRCLTGLAALLVWSHCGGAQEAPARARSALQEDCMPSGEGGCTYRGAGGGLTGWVRHYGGRGDDQVAALAPISRGGFVAAGRFGSEPFPEETGFALARYAADGTPQWERQVTTGSAQVTALAVTPMGNILAVGTYAGAVDLGTGPLPEAVETHAPYVGLFLAKFAPDGEPLWARGFTATYMRDGERETWPIIPRAVAADEQGSLIVTGDFHGEMDLGGGPLFAGRASVWPMFEVYSGGFLAKFSWSGEHLWSRVFKSHDVTRVPITSASVTVGSEGDLWVGGFAGRESDLGDGVLGVSAPFIARYDGSGRLLWKRLFQSPSAWGLYGEVTRVEPVGADQVAFLADFVGTFTFAGQSYTAGDVTGPGGQYDIRPFFGVLSLTEGDRWLRALGDNSAVWELTTQGELLTVTGSGAGLDLGGGVLGSGTRVPFVVRYKASGEHLWSRLLDGQVRSRAIASWGTFKHVGYLLVPQSCDAVVLAGDFGSTVQLDETTYHSNGGQDLLYFQLSP